MASLLSKKVAIVTGASSGIGEAIALMFASRGAKVALCGRDHERLKAVFDKVVNLSGGCKDSFLTVQGDLNESGVRKEIVEKTVDKFGRLDILVANAGVTQNKQSIMAATEETYDVIMDTNLKSLFFLIQEAAPHLEKSKGNLINMSSSITSGFSPTTLVYSLSKIALDHLTKCVAIDLGHRGIRANVVNPGFIPTRMLRQHGEKTAQVNSSVLNFDLGRQNLKDKLLTMDDITEAVAFLASDAAGFITGQSITVDGGRILTGHPIWPGDIIKQKG